MSRQRECAKKNRWRLTFYMLALAMAIGSLLDPRCYFLCAFLRHFPTCPQKYLPPPRHPSAPAAVVRRDMSKAAAFNAVEPKPTEVSVIGQLQGATGLAASSAHCTWRITHGKTWTLERGEGSGSSHTATTNENGAIVWSHPIDAVLVGTDTGWPRLELEVRSRDEFDRSDLAGYAVVHVPATPGVHELHCPIWKPKGTLGDRIAAAFIGGGASLKDSAVVFGTLAENGKGLERGGFATVGAGQVHLQLTVCSRRVEPRRLPPKVGEGDEDDD